MHLNDYLLFLEKSQIYLKCGFILEQKTSHFLIFFNPFQPNSAKQSPVHSKMFLKSFKEKKNSHFSNNIFNLSENPDKISRTADINQEITNIKKKKKYVFLLSKFLNDFQCWFPNKSKSIRIRNSFAMNIFNNLYGNIARSHRQIGQTAFLKMLLVYIIMALHLSFVTDNQWNVSNKFFHCFTARSYNVTMINNLQIRKRKEKKSKIETMMNKNRILFINKNSVAYLTLRR